MTATLPSTQLWGDLFAGRLESTWTASYQVTLAAGQNMSYAVVDRYVGTAGCNVQADLYPPSELSPLFGAQPVTSFRDGPAAGEPLSIYATGSGGGLVTAPIAGTYVIKLTNYGGSASCWYRFFVATSASQLGTLRPVW